MELHVSESVSEITTTLPQYIIPIFSLDHTAQGGEEGCFLVFIINNMFHQFVIYLQVRVLRCDSLPKMDTIGSCDAIVKLAIHPKYTKELEKLKSFKTKTVKSLNPEFPE